MLPQRGRECDDLTYLCRFLSHLIDKRELGIACMPGGGREAAEDLLDKTLQGVPNGDKIMDTDRGQKDNKTG